ncbi:MAG: carbohydrate kinase family protein [Cyanobacteria bacterium SZAS TMP-1]|nr:carbohydrate kinase family protein [Cyanobacteria bacterium SZAS TMP-1]
MKVVTVGELVVDWIAADRSASWQDPHTFIRSLGGNSANVALGISRLGGDVRLIAKIGADLHGNYLLHYFKDIDVDTDFVFQSEQFATAQCYVLTDESGENLFFNWPRPNACHQLTEDEFDPAMLDGAFCLHATGISLTVEPRAQFIIKIIREARAAGLTVSFDAGFPTGEGELAQKLVREAMSLSDLLKVNLPELIYWLVPAMEPARLAEVLDNPGKKDNLEELKKFCREFRVKSGTKILMCTLGAYGSIVTTETFQGYAPPHILEVVAGVGAGDAYVAAVLHKLAQEPKPINLDRIDWLPLANFANAAGALATRTISASEGLPTLAEVEELLRKAPPASPV